ncbi:MAG: hypothetical protein U5L04_14080 [Trueperaceae bacterium]|nr:hypothetical protein [Trueperaceae bacterium]
MNRCLQVILASALMTSGGIPVVYGAPALPGTGDCATAGTIERTLGSHGYRVVMSGAHKEGDGHTVKLQVWENEDRDWVITEAFLGERRTCVLRTGRLLDTLY